MSSAYCPSASIYNYPSQAVSPWTTSQEDHQLPDLGTPPSRPITPYPNQTTSSTPPRTLLYPSRMTTPELITRGQLQERRNQLAIHIAMAAQAVQMMGWSLQDIIQNF